MKPINEHLIQLTGKANIKPKDYETGEDVILIVKGSIYNIVRSDNHDGTDDLIIKIKAIDVQDSTQ